MRKSAYRSYSLNLPESGESSPHQRMCSKQNYLGRIIPSLGALSGLSHLTTHLSLGFQLRQIRRVILLTQHTAQVLRHGIALVGVERVRVPWRDTLYRHDMVLLASMNTTHYRLSTVRPRQ